MSATQNLKYYLAHPDEMPEDPKEIERLTNEHMQAAIEGGTEQLSVETFVPAGEEPKDKAEPEPEAKAEEEPAAKAEAEPETEAKPEGILAKDGKNVIPYSQLESARARATAAEALARDQAAQIEALKAEKTQPQGAVTEMLTEEELAVLEADSPTLAKTLRAQQAAIQKLSGTVEELRTRANNDAATEETAVKSEIQTAIDANPTLASWQTAEDQTLWLEASRFDKLLRESPKYANVSFADRFEKVVELTASALGLELETTPPALTQEEIKAAAAVKLKAAGKRAVPRSLSDIPGGAPPAVDEKAKVEGMSSVELGSMFLGMTREQQDAYLATL